MELRGNQCAYAGCKTCMSVFNCELLVKRQNEILRKSVVETLPAPASPVSYDKQQLILMLACKSRLLGLAG